MQAPGWLMGGEVPTSWPARLGCDVKLFCVQLGSLAQALALDAGCSFCRAGSPLHTDGMQLFNMTKLLRSQGPAAGECGCLCKQLHRCSRMNDGLRNARQQEVGLQDVASGTALKQCTRRHGCHQLIPAARRSHPGR